MAGGSGSTKEGGSLEKDRARICHQRQRNFRSSFVVPHQPQFSECYKKRRSLEKQRTRSLSVQNLQRDIRRIFVEHLHSDFHIIHDTCVVKTNVCIVEARSPLLHQTLRTYIVRNNDTTECYIDSLEIFRRIKDFARLLYNNSDVKREEEALVDLIKSVNINLECEERPASEHTIDPERRTCRNADYLSFKHVERATDDKTDGPEVLSPSNASEMADSGLETGSVSPQETTESENSVTDHEESRCTDYASMDDDPTRITVNGDVDETGYKKSSGISVCRTTSPNVDVDVRSNVATTTKTGKTRATSLTMDDVADLAGCSKSDRATVTDDHSIKSNSEKIVDTRESDGRSTDNDEKFGFATTKSFDNVEPEVSSSSSTILSTCEKITKDEPSCVTKTRSMNVEELRHELSRSNDATLKKSFSGTSGNYYFIDASSLSDDSENPVYKSKNSTTTKFDESSTMYVPTRRTSGYDENNHEKFKTKKSSNLQNGHERIAEFERELKMTERLEPMKEQRKVRRVDSTSDDKSNGGTSDRTIEKETLVVEIKEADSGESAHPSPSENDYHDLKLSTNIVGTIDDIAKKHTSTRESNDDVDDVQDDDDDDEDESQQDHHQQRKRRRAQRHQQQKKEEEQQQQQQPTLIRRNTFELDPNDGKLSTLRQDHERRQGHLLFQSSIPQYSGHRVDGDSCFEPTIERTIPTIPPVVDLLSKFSIDRTPIKYSSITYLTTNDRSNVSAIATIAGRDGRCANYEDDDEMKYSATSILPSANSTRDAKISGSISTNDETRERYSATSRLSNDERTMTSWTTGDFNVGLVKNVVPRDGESTIMDSRYKISSNISEFSNRSTNCFTSLPVDLNYDEATRKNRGIDLAATTTTIDRLKSDATVDHKKSTDGGIVNRNSESTPTIHDDSISTNDDSLDPRAKTSRMSSSMTSWIVDMSDSGKNVFAKSSSTSDDRRISMSQSLSNNDRGDKKIAKKFSFEPKHSSLGYFVNLRDNDEDADDDDDDNDDDGDRSTNGTRTANSRSKKNNRIDTTTTTKQSCEFFVDISNDSSIGLTNSRSDNGDVNVDCGGGSSCSSSSTTTTTSRDRINGDKKNIFSMFIDLNEPIDRRDPTTNSRSDSIDDVAVGKSRISTTTRNVDEKSSNVNSTINDRNKPGVFMFIESDSPIVRRRAMSSSRPSAFQRHSWNVDKLRTNGNNGFSPIDPTIDDKSSLRREHKRAHSVSIDRADLRKLRNASSRNSTHSLSEIARADPLNGTNERTSNERESNDRNTDTSIDEILEHDGRHTPPNSHVEIVDATTTTTTTVIDRDHRNARTTTETVDPLDDDRSELSMWEKTGGTDSTEGNTRKSETFDISSGASGPSPEIDDNRQSDVDLSPIGETIVGENTLPTTAAAAAATSEEERTSKKFVNEKSLTQTIMKIGCEFKKSDFPVSDEICRVDDTPILSRDNPIVSSRDFKDDRVKIVKSSFVRLSDLDKTPLRTENSEPGKIREADNFSTVGRNVYRMSNSIPETSWIESKLAINRGNVPVRTLGTRKFTSVMSTSLPAKNKSPIDDREFDGEAVVSESDLSSLQSSMCRSGADVSTEETETSSMGISTKPYNRLGEDLLRMFLEEINPDVTIDVGGRRIRAHKCILSSRCQYFAAILSGGWIESADNMISLQGYSYNAVHFALCHIYSGESNIPETLCIVELATLADMLCLEGLKEVIGYTVKLKYCHMFHKPCQVCAVGVIECMPLAAACGLDEVYRKSLRWITRHFVRIWPSKAFANLPRELMDKCYHQHIVHMSTDNVLQTMMDCDKLLATLPNVRWAEPIFRMVSNLLETAVKFISENFSGVLANENFQALGRNLTWNISRLEDNFLAAADRLPPDQACKSYSKINKMLATARIEETHGKTGCCWGPLFVDFLVKIQSRVEKCLVKEASRAARTTTWLKMDLELRRRIQELACLVILPHETPKRPSRRSNFLKEPKAPTAKTPVNRNSDLRRVKMAITEHTERITKSTTTVTNTTTMSAPNTSQQIKKTVLVKPRSDPLERKVTQDEKPVASNSTGLRPKSWPNKLEVKSRYLEPRNKSAPKEIVNPPHHERVIIQQRRKIMISSSDSSRTSSPAMKRAVEKKTMGKIKLPIKKDARTLSSDSLMAEASTSSRSTATRKEIVSKSCGITRPESPLLGKMETVEICLSADSLAAAEPRNEKRPIAARRSDATNKMDTSMSTDSLMAEVTSNPKSADPSNKVSPTMTRIGANRIQQIHDRSKKSSPPVQPKKPSTIVRPLTRTLECSTAASRNRAAATVSAYHGSPNLRRNLLEAAKTPDVPSRTSNPSSSRISPRQRSSSTASPPQSTSSAANATTSSSASFGKKDKKEISTNQTNVESPGKRSSPKSNVVNRSNRIITGVPKRTIKPGDDKTKNKFQNVETPKNQPTVGSRSGTFLKDEPTILKKSDIKSVQISSS